MVEPMYMLLGKSVWPSTTFALVVQHGRVAVLICSSVVVVVTIMSRGRCPRTPARWEPLGAGP